MAKTAVVIGASRGIGFELVKQLQERNFTVIGTVRTTTPALESLDARIESGVDVTSDADVADLAERLSGVTIDLLICNAGVLSSENLEDLDFDRIRRQFEVNTLGPLRVVQALRGHMAARAKVGLVTSRMGSIADNTSGGMYGYRMSKAALCMAGVSLARDLEGAGIAVALLHPGYVRTDMTGGRGLIDASESAAGLIARLDDLSIETTGSFWHMSGETLPW